MARRDREARQSRIAERRYGELAREFFRGNLPSDRLVAASNVLRRLTGERTPRHGLRKLFIGASTAEVRLRVRALKGAVQAEPSPQMPATVVFLPDNQSGLPAKRTAIRPDSDSTPVGACVVIYDDGLTAPR